MSSRVIDLPASTRIAANGKVVGGNQPFPNIIHRVCVLSEDYDAGIRVERASDIAYEPSRLGVLAGDLIEFRDKQSQFFDLITEEVGSRIDLLRVKERRLDI